MSFKPILAALAAALCSQVAQAADLVEINWSADGKFAVERTVPAGKFLEVCGKLPAGASVAWEFVAGGPTNFNIHFHEGKQVRYPAQLQSVDKAGDVLKVEAEQDYCWMWSNKSKADTAVKLSLKRG